MYKFIFFLSWVVLVVAPFIKFDLFQGKHQSYNNYISKLKQSFVFGWIALYKEGIEDNEESFMFLISFFLYVLLAGIASMLWIIFIPIIALTLLTKKLLKKKS
jgi:hypothetical protein